MVYRGPLSGTEFLPLGGGPPLNATVGVVSSIVVSAVQFRRKVVFCNDSDTVIYLARADEARLNAGIRLGVGSVLVDEPDQYGRMYSGPWAAISSAANKNLTISVDN